MHYLSLPFHPLTPSSPSFPLPTVSLLYLCPVEHIYLYIYIYINEKKHVIFVFLSLPHLAYQVAHQFHLFFPANNIISLFFIAEYNSMVCIYYQLIPRSPGEADGRLMPS